MATPAEHSDVDRYTTELLAVLAEAQLRVCRFLYDLPPAVRGAVAARIRDEARNFQTAYADLLAGALAELVDDGRLNMSEAARAVTAAGYRLTGDSVRHTLGRVQRHEAGVSRSKWPHY